MRIEQAKRLKDLEKENTRLKRLVADGIVGSEGDTRMQKYFIKEPERVMELLVTFRTSFVDKMVDALLDAWIG